MRHGTCTDGIEHAKGHNDDNRYRGTLIPIHAAGMNVDPQIIRRRLPGHEQKD